MAQRTAPVVAGPEIGSIDGHAKGDSLLVGQHGPPPSLFGPVRRVLARSLTPTRTFVQTPADGHVAEIEPVTLSKPECTSSFRLLKIPL